MQLRNLSLCAVIAFGCRGPYAPTPTPTPTPIPTPLFETSSYALVQEPQAPPWSLTASDGSGLVMTRVDAKAVVQGPLAFTELHLHFHNPEDRIREGRFEIALPAGAAISRFAMESNGAWMEAEVVEKMTARRAYEEFLHRRQDPALLEKAAGNQFTARVFPIPARGDKHLVISFSQELRGERYVLPLRGLPAVARVDARLIAFGADGRRTEQVLAERAWQPDRDFVSTLAAPDAVGAGTLVAAQFAVSGAAVAADAPSGVTLLVDTSASRSLGFGRTIRATSELIAALGKRHGAALPVEVYAYDQTTQRIFRGAASAWSTAQEGALAVRGAAGASDLGQALAAIAGQQPHARVALITDGVATAGADSAALATAAKRIGGVERFDVLLAGGIRDPELAAVLASAGARAGAVIDLERGADDAAAALGERLLTNVAIDVPGAVWSYPKAIPAVRAGARVLVYARMKARAKQLAAVVNGRKQTVRISDGTPILLERALAAAAIAELEAQLAAAPRDRAKPLRAEIAKRSVAARVVSSQTSLLVLETDDDYARFGIDRRALVDILEIAADGSVVPRHRAMIAAPPPRVGQRPHRRPPPRDERALQAADPDPRFDGTNTAEGPDSDGAPLDLGEPDSNLPDELAVARKMESEQAETIIVTRSAGVSVSEAAPIAGDVGDDAMLMPQALAAHRSRDARLVEDREQWPPENAPPALRDELAEIMRDPRSPAALAKARAWHLKDPGNVLALIGMGEVFEARGQRESAARMYGSIIDLFPGRADLRRFAGERLERIGAAARTLAIDTYRRAVADRPDHLTGHRLLAYALLRAGRHAEALAAILAGHARTYPDGRFLGGTQVLAEDARLIGAAYAAAAPAQRAAITAALAPRNLAIATAPSTRFVLYWETDANDVDFHIQDRKGGHAWYSQQELASGGELFEDVTTGYGPECFAIPGEAKAGPYKLSLSYYAQGPMGYGMGLLQIVRHDGNGALTFEDRPYVIMNDRAYVDLGTY